MEKKLKEKIYFWNIDDWFNFQQDDDGVRDKDVENGNILLSEGIHDNGARSAYYIESTSFLKIWCLFASSDLQIKNILGKIRIVFGKYVGQTILMFGLWILDNCRLGAGNSRHYWIQEEICAEVVETFLLTSTLTATFIHLWRTYSQTRCNKIFCLILKYHT